LGEIVTLNLLYDLTDFKHSPFTDLNNTEDRFWSTSSLGCTSIVAINKKRQVFHGRNLDYGMPEVLKKAAIYVDFVKNGTVKK
jgi:hypothetical protein